MLISFLLIKKYLPIFNAFIIFVFALLALFLFNYSLAYFFTFSFLAIFLSLIFVLFLLQKEIRTSWPLALIFVVFVAGAIFFTIFTKNLSLKIFFILVISLFSYIFLTTIFRFLYEPRKYTIHSMENMSFSLALMMLVLVLSDFFALINFFNFSVWLSLVMVFLLVGLTFLFINWSNKLQIEKRLFFIIALIMTEFFWSLTLLPISFYISGAISGLMFFLMVNLIIKKNKEGVLTSKTLRKYALLGTIVLIFVFILAKWR